MTELLEVQVRKAIVATLKMLKPGLDLIATAESIAKNVIFTIDMNTEDSGIGVVDEGTAWNIQGMHRENTVAERREAIQSSVPPAPTSSVQPLSQSDKPSLIMLPNDPRLKQEELTAADGKKVMISAIDVKRKSAKPAANVTQLQYWDPGQLIAAIDEVTPREIRWLMDMPDDQKKQMVAQKNIINQAGLGIIDLTYKHPSVTSNPSPGNVHTLTAKVQFSCYEKEFDVEAALTEIEKQLVAMYKYRGDGTIEPNAGPEPPPLGMSGGGFNAKTAPMGTNFDLHFDKNESMVADPKGNAMQRVFNENRTAR